MRAFKFVIATVFVAMFFAFVGARHLSRAHAQPAAVATESAVEAAPTLSSKETPAPRTDDRTTTEEKPAEIRIREGAGVRVVIPEGSGLTSNLQLQDANPAIDAETRFAVVKVVFVFDGDKTRKSADGVLFEMGSDTWVATASTVVESDGTGPGIVRILIEGATGNATQTLNGDLVHHAPGLWFIRTGGHLTDFQLTNPNEPNSVTVVTEGDQLTALQTSIRQNQFVRTPVSVRVTAIDRKYAVKGLASTQKLPNMFQLSETLPEGTPLFKNGRLAGITVIGTRFLNEKSSVSYVLPIDYIRQQAQPNQTPQTL
jgi:hypothetical protein